MPFIQQKNYFIIFIFILIIVLALILAPNFIIFISRVYGGKDSTNLSNLLCEKTLKYSKKFINNEINPKKISKINGLFDDITHDMNVKSKTIDMDTLNIKTGKIILNLILNCYIYEKSPNNIIRELINDDIENLKSISKETCFNNINEIIYKAKHVVDLHKSSEIKQELMSSKDAFRKIKLLELSDIKDELSKKNIELRECESKLGKEKYNDTLKWQSCEREKSLLQEKIYDLKRDLEGYRRSGINDDEKNRLQSRLDECQRQNSNISNDLRLAREEHDRREAEIRKLSQDLEECRMIASALAN